MNDAEQADALEKTLTDEERALLDRIADGLHQRRLGTAAIFFLESVKPLGYVASQAMHFFRPMVQAVIQSPVAWDQVAKIMERRGAAELLLRRLEKRA